MNTVCQVPVRFCGQGCESHEGPEECRERETDVLHDVPGKILPKKKHEYEILEQFDKTDET